MRIHNIARLIIGLSWLLVGATANSAHISLYINYPDGLAGTKWEVTASTCGCESAGIFSVGFSATGISSMSFRGPIQQFVDNEISVATNYGFTTQLGPKGVLPGGPSSTNAYTITQGLSDPASAYIYDAGIAAGNANTLIGPPNSTLVPSPASAYAVPILLFSGTKPAGGEISLFGFSGAVFKVAGAGAGANLDTSPPPPFGGGCTCPEPATHLLVAIGAGGILLIYRSATRRDSSTE